MKSFYGFRCENVRSFTVTMNRFIMQTFIAAEDIYKGLGCYLIRQAIVLEQLPLALQILMLSCALYFCSNGRSLFYRVRFDFHKRRFYRDWSILSPSSILSFMEKTFLLRLSRAVDKHIREMQKMS